MAVLSIQSTVAHGHVGNAAAVFALQRLGVDVWPVHTVQLSNHTAHAAWGGGALGAGHVRDVLRGIEETTGFAGLDAVLTGYVGSAGLAAVIAETVDRVRARRPAALYCCDPVMGNAARGLYVAEDTAAAIASELVPRADMATPNAFELSRLADRPVADAAEALAAADALAGRGPPTVVVTSLAAGVGLGVLARDEGGAWLVETPRLAAAAHGAGDTLTALLLGRTLRGAALPDALSDAVSSTFALLRAGAPGEPALIDAQDAIAAPPRRFPARRLETPGRSGLHSGRAGGGGEGE